MNRQELLAEYRANLLAARAPLALRHPWAQDADKLARFMISVERTISTEVKTWNHDSPAMQRAYRKLGGKGKATLKALRAIPAI